MWGAEGAVSAVMERLEERLPGKIAELRARYGADETVLPDVTRVSPVLLAATSIETFPIVMLDVEDTDPQRGVSISHEDGDMQTLEVPYRIKTYVYAMGDTEETTWRRVARYLLAVREILLESPMISAQGTTGVIDTNSFHESFSDFAANDAGKLLSGASLKLTLVGDERLPSPAALMGKPAIITETIRVVGPGQSLRMSA